MKIILTGINGFIGCHLENYLTSQNHIVEKISVRKKWSLSDNADILIHLAGKSEDSNKSSLEDYLSINRDITIDLFQDFLNSNIKDFIYFSSIKAVKDEYNDILTEDIYPSPISPYGRSKYEAEKYLLSQKLPNDKRLFIIRPCVVYGQGNKGNLSLLHKWVKLGLPWIFRAFDNQKSFLHIDNLCYCIEKIITNDEIHSDIFHISDDNYISTNELIELIALGLKKKVNYINIPKRIICKIFKIGDFLKLGINSKTLTKLTSSYIVSNKKIKKALNITKLPMDTKDGIVEFIKSLDKRG